MKTQDKIKLQKDTEELKENLREIKEKIATLKKLEMMFELALEMGTQMLDRA